MAEKGRVWRKGGGVREVGPAMAGADRGDGAGHVEIPAASAGMTETGAG